MSESQAQARAASSKHERDLQDRLKKMQQDILAICKQDFNMALDAKNARLESGIVGKLQEKLNMKLVQVNCKNEQQIKSVHETIINSLRQDLRTVLD